MQKSTLKKYATPSGADAHIDVPMSNMAVRAFNDNVDDFIGAKLVPAVPVGKQSDKYYTISKGDFLRVQTALRAPKTKARRVEFDVSSDSFFADNFALANENALEDMANHDTAIQLRENSVSLITTDLLRDQEDRIATLLTTAGNLGSGTTLTGANQWTDFTGSDPIADVTTGHAYIRAQTGLVANTMMMDYDTAQIVRRHPLLLDMYKHTQAGMVSMDNLKDVFGVKDIHVGMAVKENALEGGTSSITNIWGNNALLAHIGPATGLQTKSLALRFQWRPAGFPADFQVERMTVNGAGTEKVEVIEAGHFQDEKVIASELGYLIVNPRA
tara:strand:+ start:3146 stop:4132 length:987 start_codon:yes stop_codon:yes gene_type:complete